MISNKNISVQEAVKAFNDVLLYCITQQQCSNNCCFHHHEHGCIIPSAMIVAKDRKEQ